MRCLRLVWRRGMLALFTITGWLAVTGIALAQPGQPQKPEPSSGSYVFPYALLLLGVGLGLMCVCRSSRRRDRARPEQYDEAKALGKD